MSSTTTQTTGPPVEVDEAVLEREGFTPSGVNRFCATVRDYAAILLERSVYLGEAHKAPGLQREVTHDHVQSSAHSIARGFGLPRRSRWMIVAQVCEYIATAAAGVGGGHLDKPWGVAVFGLALAVAVVLVVTRLTFGRGGE